MQFLKRITLILTAVAIPVSMHSQSFSKQESLAVTVRGGALFNTHSANFSSFTGIADCAPFTEGSGTGLSGSVGIEIPLNPTFYLSLTAGYYNRTASLASIVSFPGRDRNNINPTAVYLENTIAATLKYIELIPEIRPTVIKNVINGPLRGVFGTRLSFPISPSFLQKERILSPENAVFVHDELLLREREIFSGTLTTATPVGFGLTIGLEHALKLSEKLVFTQQGAFDYTISPIVDDASWSINSYRFELGLRYSFLSNRIDGLPKDSAPPVIERSITIAVPPKQSTSPKLSISIDRIDGEIVTGNEVLASPPVVNAVFFAQNSSKIPDRYHIAEKLDPKEYFSVPPIDFHRYILLHVANLFAANPDMKINLIGSTSGDDEPEGIALATTRATELKKLLTDLGVAEKSISISAKILPAVPSNAAYVGGREENRRVDIGIENAQLQTYASREKFALFNGVATVVASLENMTAREIKIDGSCMQPTLVTLKQNNLSLPLNCRIDEKQTLLPISFVAATTSFSSRAFKEINLTEIPKRNSDLILSNFDAILRFGYDNRILSQENKELLRQMSELIPAGSTIIIYGGADALGTEEYNKKLSQDRADATVKYIRSIVENKFNIVTSVTTEKFPEDLPEGRFLNRNLRIKVR